MVYIGHSVLWCVEWRFVLSCVFFFQAEDGIRDLVRSRGLGDVYKRQDPSRSARHLEYDTAWRAPDRAGSHGQRVWQHPGPVSYTHLTLPTSDLV